MEGWKLLYAQQDWIRLSFPYFFLIIFFSRYRFFIINRLQPLAEMLELFGCQWTPQQCVLRLMLKVIRGIVHLWCLKILEGGLDRRVWTPYSIFLEGFRPSWVRPGVWNYLESKDDKGCEKNVQKIQFLIDIIYEQPLKINIIILSPCDKILWRFIDVFLQSSSSSFIHDFQHFIKFVKWIFLVYSVYRKRKFLISLKNKFKEFSTKKYSKTLIMPWHKVNKKHLKWYKKIFVENWRWTWKAKKFKLHLK